MGKDLTSDELYAIADVVGWEIDVEVCADLGAGADGVVYLLEDGGCLKLTRSTTEAIVANMLAERWKAGNPIPGFPRFRGGFAIDGIDGAKLHVVVREAAETAYPDPTEDELAEEKVLRQCLRYIDHAWEIGLDREENRYLYAVALAEWGSRKPALSGLVEGLRTLRDELGVSVQDLHYDNFGVTDSGELCVRDLSRSEMDMPLYRSESARLPRLDVSEAMRLAARAP